MRDYTADSQSQTGISQAQAIALMLAKYENAIPQNVSDTIASDEVVDIFAAAGMKNPDISIISEEFFADVCQLPQLHPALELLRKLINDDK